MIITPTLNFTKKTATLYKFIFGLANDELGYIIPKSEWDEKPPYLYDSPEQLYGEINSVGPETAAIIHREVSALLRELNTSATK